MTQRTDSGTDTVVCRWLCQFVGRWVVAGLVAHVLQCLLLVSFDAASVRWASPRLLIVPVAAVLGAAVLPHLVGAPTPVPLLQIAGVWLAAGLAHHYLVGITATWDGRPVRGLAHVTWDLAFHVPALAVAAWGTRRSVGSPTPE